MILADTSVWVDHFRFSDQALIGLLNSGQVLIHPAVIGELALGNLRQRDVILRLLKSLEAAVRVGEEEMLRFIDANAIFGRGIGYVDAVLLASTRLTPAATLWTRDKRLRAIAAELGVVAPLD
jgi:hypothetical protein